MNTLACYKIVYEDQDIIIKSDNTLSFDRAELKLSLYDLNAIEEAVCIAEATSGKAVALSIGDNKVNNSKLKKGALSRGPQELYLVQDDKLENTDTNQTARIIAAAAKKIDYDIIICGEGSADSYAQQTGLQVGHILSIPVINAVSKITPLEGKILVERTLEDVVEILEIDLPAVICVTSDVNKTRLPSMKDILAAGKKPVTTWTIADIGIDMPDNTVDTISTLAPEQQERQKMIFEGEDKVSELFENISKLLK